MSEARRVDPSATTPPARVPEARLLAGLAAAIVACYLLLSLAGGKEASAALSAPAPANTALLGLMWVAAHLGLVIVAPVLALASAVRLALERVTRRA